MFAARTWVFADAGGRAQWAGSALGRLEVTAAKTHAVCRKRSTFRW